jgi:hypothetical protein
VVECAEIAPLKSAGRIPLNMFKVLRSDVPISNRTLVTRICLAQETASAVRGSSATATSISRQQYHRAEKVATTTRLSNVKMGQNVPQSACAKLFTRAPPQVLQICRQL